MKKKNEEDDDVEELLRAAQDELLLKLSVNSHMTRVDPDYLHPDLDRRFQALKSKPQQQQQQPRQHQSSTTGATSQVQDPDDLMARFAALKGSSEAPIHSPPSDDEEDDEVDKIIRWAKDAARLDPSPPSDDELDARDDTDTDDDDRDRVSK